jgi:hypothetical protein
MAEQPPSSDKFSEYVNLYYSQLTGGRAKPTGEPVEFPDLPAPKQELGFLGRTVDILSRPMRVISNPVMKAVELPERFDKVQELRVAGDEAGATKEALSAVGSLLASPFTGFFSDDPLRVLLVLLVTCYWTRCGWCLVVGRLKVLQRPVKKRVRQLVVFQQANVSGCPVLQILCLLKGLAPI